MNGKLYINGYDAYETWGVILEDGSYEKLLTGETMKEYTTNESRSADGKQVLIKNPRIADRSVTLTFCFVNHSASFLTRFNAFFSELRKGMIQFKVTELNSTYRLIYEANTSVSQVNLSLAKVSVKFNEPNPTNRDI